jgi:hypothetical protein
MKQRQPLRGIGVLLVLLGIVAGIVGVVGLFETRWIVDPLEYHDVRYLEGYRTGPSIHIVAKSGQIYRLPERLWPEDYDGPALVARLAEESSARAEAVGGTRQFWFGYPRIESFETPTLTLTAPPVSRARSRAPLLAAPLFAVSGLFLLRWLRGFDGPRCSS